MREKWVCGRGGGPSEISTLLGLTGGDLIILPFGTSLAAYRVLCEFKAYMHLATHRFFDGTEERRGPVFERECAELA